MTRYPILLTLVVLASACGSAPKREAPRAERTTIVASEIQEARVATAYEALERLRPEFLRGRGPFSIGSPQAGLPVVYVDGVRTGDIAQLRGIPSNTVESMHFFSAADATTRWGTGHPGGVIDVRIKR